MNLHVEGQSYQTQSPQLCITINPIPHINIVATPKEFAHFFVWVFSVFVFVSIVHNLINDQELTLRKSLFLIISGVVVWTPIWFALKG